MKRRRFCWHCGMVLDGRFRRAAWLSLGVALGLGGAGAAAIAWLWSAVGGDWLRLMVAARFGE